jgi:Spy/CpxP family protein refolding chaperone
MIALRQVVSAVCLAAALIGTAAYADTVAPTAAPDATVHDRGHGGFRHVLQQLDLSPDQQTQIKAIFAQAKGQWQATGASKRANHVALATTPPTDPDYPALLAAEQANAVARIQAASDIKTQVYAVLTDAQKQRIPALLAADRAAREARIAAWRAHHPQS